MKLSFIVPCYNEEKNISLFYKNLEDSFKNSKYKIELIFIDDGSKDKTYDELKKIIKKREFSLKIMNFSRNFGKEAAIFAGLKECTGDYAVLIDADMQQPPRLVLDMLNIIETKNDIDIVAFYQENRIENKLLSFIKSGFYKIMSNCMDSKVKNGASDFRLLNRKVINAILSFSEHNRFSKGIFAWIGFNTYYLPYTPEKRANGETSWNFLDLFKYAINGILSFSKKPLSIIFKLGIFNLFISIIWFIFLLVLGFNDIQFIGVLILFIFGINLMILGLISEYMFRIYTESQNRPIYIVKEIVENEKNN